MGARVGARVGGVDTPRPAAKGCALREIFLKKCSKHCRFSSQIFYNIPPTISVGLRLAAWLSESSLGKAVVIELEPSCYLALMTSPSRTTRPPPPRRPPAADRRPLPLAYTLAQTIIGSRSARMTFQSSFAIERSMAERCALFYACNCTLCIMVFPHSVRPVGGGGSSICSKRSLALNAAMLPIITNVVLVRDPP